MRKLAIAAALLFSTAAQANSVLGSADYPGFSVALSTYQCQMEGGSGMRMGSLFEANDAAQFGCWAFKGDKVIFVWHGKGKGNPINARTYPITDFNFNK